MSFVPTSVVMACVVACRARWLKHAQCRHVQACGHGGKRPQPRAERSPPDASMRAMSPTAAVDRAQCDAHIMLRVPRAAAVHDSRLVANENSFDWIGHRRLFPQNSPQCNRPTLSFRAPPIRKCDRPLRPPPPPRPRTLTHIHTHHMQVRSCCATQPHHWQGREHHPIRHS